MYRLLIIISILFLLSLKGFAQTDSIFAMNSFGEFSDASSISSSRGEFIFVSDIGKNQIFKFDVNCNLLQTYGGTGLGKYELNQPVSIDASNGFDIFISDQLNNRIIRLDYKLNLISIFEFNIYNIQAENSNKIFNPASLTTISTGNLFVLCDAGNYRSVRIKDFNDIDLFFGQYFDNIGDPVKIVKGISLDIWILDKSSNQLMNFNNLGIFVKKVKLSESLSPISIAYIDKNLAVIAKGILYFYDIETSKYSRAYYFPEIEKIKDISFLDDKTLFVLSKNRVFILKLN